MKTDKDYGPLQKSDFWRLWLIYFYFRKFPNRKKI